MGEGPLLVVSAVEREATPLRALLVDSSEPRVHIVTCGVGKVAAALATARAIDAHAPSSVLCLGCAGAFRGRSLDLGDVIIGTAEILADEGVETGEGFLGIDSLGLPGLRRGEEQLTERVPIQSPSTATLERLAKACDIRVQAGLLLTVSTGSGTDERSRALAARHDALGESLEGAAVAAAAWQAGLPAREVRGVSNFTGHRDRAAWRIDLACRNAARVAHQWILTENLI